MKINNVILNYLSRDVNNPLRAINNLKFIFNDKSNKNINNDIIFTK